MIQQNRQNGIYWVNFFSNGQFYIQNQKRREECFDFVKKIINELQNGNEQHLNSYGFINNPKNAASHQGFHFDYHESSITVLIPLVHLVYENSPQFLSERPCEPIASQRGIIQHFGASERHLLERSGKDFLVISQLISKPYVMLKIEAGTCHRGIKNLSNEDRPVFFLNYSPQKIQEFKEQKSDAYKS